MKNKKIALALLNNVGDISLPYIQCKLKVSYEDAKEIISWIVDNYHVNEFLDTFGNITKISLP